MAEMSFGLRARQWDGRRPRLDFSQRAAAAWALACAVSIAQLTYRSGCWLKGERHEKLQTATVVAGMLGAALLAMPATSAPISAVPLTQLAGTNHPQGVQV